ncbi:pfh1, partial [Symbiodinium sp. CCMP2456]
THVLTLLRELFQMLGYHEGLDFEVAAFQCVNAADIGGKTLHGACGLSIGATCLEKEAGRDTAKRVACWRWLIIDEISMVCARLLAQVDHRLRAQQQGRPPHRPRAELIRGPDDPRLQEPKFRGATAIVANNDARSQINKDRIRWLQYHDRDTGDLCGVLPLAVGMPVALTQHLDKRKSLLRGRIGYVHSWRWDENDQQPRVVYVKFEGATWQLKGSAEPGLYPVVPVLRPWFLDRNRPKP